MIETKNSFDVNQLSHSHDIYEENLRLVLDTIHEDVMEEPSCTMAEEVREV